MKVLENALNKIDGYLLSIKRNTIKGDYELEVGIPTNWAYKSNEKIECEVIHETKQGSIVKIFALEEGVVVDDLIEFVNIIIDTNQKIAKMQEEFDRKLEEQAKKMEEEVKKFYERIEVLKESSFEEMEEKQKKVIHKLEKKQIEKEVSDEELEREVEEKLSN